MPESVVAINRHPDDVLTSYVEQIKAADIDITLTDHILLDIWKKFVLLSGTSGITASTRQPLGVIRDDEDMRAFFYKLMRETIAVGSAAGVKFPPDFPAELDALVGGFAPMMKASMANDPDAGNRLELDWLAGKVVALGREYGTSRRLGRRRSTRFSSPTGWDGYVSAAETSIV